MEVTGNYDKIIFRIVSGGDFCPNYDDFKKENGKRELETASTDNSSEKFYCQKEEKTGTKCGQKSGIKKGVFEMGVIAA